jgi:hypothetical protein
MYDTCLCIVLVTLLVGARFSAPVQTGPEAHPALLYNVYRLFPGGKAAGALCSLLTPI